MLVKTFDANPSLFCAQPNVAAAWKNAQTVYKELMAHPQGTPFINKMVSTKSFTIEA